MIMFNYFSNNTSVHRILQNPFCYLLSECVLQRTADFRWKIKHSHIRSEPENILEAQSFLGDKYEFLIQLRIFFGFQYLHLTLRCMQLENSVSYGWNHVSVFEFFKQNEKENLRITSPVTRFRKSTSLSIPLQSPSIKYLFLFHSGLLQRNSCFFPLPFYFFN